MKEETRLEEEKRHFEEKIKSLEALNEEGQAAALRHLQELAQIPAYQANPQPAGKNQDEPDPKPE